MTTAEQLLASIREVDKTFIIDNDLRTIKIPADITNLGVQSDDDVMTVYFQMPGTYCGIDLSEFNIRINYLNANSEGDYHDVDDAEVQSDGTIRFSWTIGRHAASVVGNVTFNVCMKKSDSSGNVIKEFNTTLASLPILEGLEISEQVISEYNDILEQWRAKLFGVGDTEEARLIAVSQEQQQVISEQSATVLSDIELKGSETLATIPDTYTEVYNMAEEALRTKADAIVLEAEGTVISVNDSSDDHLRNLKVFGRTTQDGTPTPDAPVELVSVENPTVNICGKNLLNIRTPPIAVLGAEVVVDGESVTVSSTDDLLLTRAVYSVNYPKNVPFTISFDATVITTPSTALGSTVRMRKGANSTGISMIDLTQVGVKKHYKVTADPIAEDGYELWLYLRTFNDATGYVSIKFENIQIEVGTEATEYEPYKPIQTITLNHTLHGIPVSDGGNYTDENGQQWICDEVDFDRGVYVQRIFSETFTDFSDAINYNNDGNGTSCAMAVGVQLVATQGMCSHLLLTTIATDNNRFNPMDGVVYFKLEGEFTVQELKNKLAEMSPSVVAILKTPIETPLTSEEILAYKKLKTNRTNTTVLNDQNARMAIAYSADTLKFLRDNQPKPTDEQVEAAVNEYADEHGVQVPNDDYIKNLAEQVAASALDIFRSNLKPAKIGEVTLPATAWVGEANLYSQVVSIDGVTEHSQVDLTPDVQQLAVFYEKDLTFVTENEDGVVTVYAIGQKPTNDYTIQVTITEVEV